MGRFLLLGVSVVALAMVLVHPAGAATTTVAKSADESLSASTGVQNDDELLFTPAAGVVYDVTVFLSYASPAGAGTPDIKVAAGEDSTARGACSVVGVSAGDGGQSVGFLTTGASTVSVGTGTAKRGLALTCSIVGNGGTWNVKWAQNTSDASATTVYAGSFLRYRTASGEAVAWGDVTGKPDFEATYCNADGTEADEDCAAAEDATTALAPEDRERLSLIWYGVWALVGLAFVSLIAAPWYRAWGIEGKLGHG